MTPTDWISEAVAALKPLATLNEASAVLRTSPRNLRRLIASGRIQSLRATDTGSSRVLIPRAEVARYLRTIAPDTSAAPRRRATR